MKFVTELNLGIVVERAGLNALKTDEYEKAMADIYSKGKPVRIVDNATKFFSDASLENLLNNPCDDLHLVADKRGITLSITDLATIRAFDDLKKRIREELGATMAGSYVFAEVPDSFSLENYIFSKSYIYRKGKSTYVIGYKTLEKLWNMASKYWADETKTDRTYVGRIAASGYTNSVYVSPDKVEVGCQTIQRYELEQVAIHMGWEFP